MNDYLYSSRQVAAVYGVSIETVRVWAEEFVAHLSPTANPGKNKHRMFSREDLMVFSLVSEIKDQGLTFNDIHIALNAGQRGSAPDMTPDQVQSLVVSEQEKRLSLEVDYLQRTLAQVQQERDEALKRIEEMTSRAERTVRLESDIAYSEQRITELLGRLNGAEERVRELVDERSELREQLGEAKGELKALMRMLKMQGNLPGGE